tara:strand:+ start:1158 stop:1676 length:519 start_codon:yes stop_codon:yes gene_type:complete
MAKSAFDQSPGLNDVTGSVIGTAYTFSNAQVSLGAGGFGAWTDTGVTLNIAPTQDTCQIFIDGMYTVSSVYAVYFRIVRGVTPISVGTAGTALNYGSAGTDVKIAGGLTSGSTQGGATFPIQALDSPATTAPIIYKLQYTITDAPSAINKLNAENGTVIGTTQLVAFEILPL